MKTIKLIFVMLSCLITLYSCNPKELTEEKNSTEVIATGDKGDDTGEAEDGDEGAN